MNCTKFLTLCKYVPKVYLQSSPYSILRSPVPYTYRTSTSSFSKQSSRGGCVGVRNVSTVQEKEKEETTLVKFLKKVPFFNISKHRMNIVGMFLYEAIVDKVNYTEFFEEFSLPDTFYSWFVVTELHIWMLTVRCMAEGDDGKLVRNRMIEAMWADVGLRVKKLGAGSSPILRQQVTDLSEQFQAALIAYDEGLQLEDTVLAGALWRRLYQMKEVDPEHLDMLIKYIRRHITLLDHLSTKEIFTIKSLPWDFIIKKSSS